MQKNNAEPPEDTIKHLVSLYHAEKYQNLLDKAKNISQKFPYSYFLFNIYGATYQKLQQYQNALIAYNKAISLRPYIPSAHYNKGRVLQEQKKLDNAIKSYTQATLLNANHLEAHYNKAICHANKGELKKAIDSFEQVLKINPKHYQSHNDIGNALQILGHLDQAIESYKRAISIAPKYTEAQYNLGYALECCDQFEAAIEAYSTAISINPNHELAQLRLIYLIKTYNISKYSSKLEDALCSVLNRNTIPDIRHVILFAIKLIKWKIFSKYQISRNLDLNNPKNFQFVAEALSNTPLLLKLMSVSPIFDIDIEELLINVRYYILKNISILSNGKLLQLQTALAKQCFINEYIYQTSSKEIKILHELQNKIEEFIRHGDQPDDTYILCVASYKPLNTFSWTGNVKANGYLKSVIEMQVLEPQVEIELKSKIQSFGNITETTSRMVRQQYEEDPYPRWIKLGLPQKKICITDLIKKLNLKVSNLVVFSTDNPNVLIAGCGTGQHAIRSAYRFKASKVLAIDLSLTSLAYAARQTQKLQIPNINYLHGDILEIRKLDRKFHVVESIGVLHHMNNPLAGWQCLVDCLHPGGLMRIGLYSALARQSITQFRWELTQWDISCTKDNIRALRAEMNKQNDIPRNEIHKWQDYYCMSGFRDLVFNIKEHNFTIPEIEDCLSVLGLDFCGFENPQIVSRFKNVYPEKESEFDLKKWNTFEQKNPHTFSEMYQFWTQKRY